MKIYNSLITRESCPGYKSEDIAAILNTNNIDINESILILTFASSCIQETIDKAVAFFDNVDNYIILYNTIREENNIYLNEYLLFQE